jgi:hypothetical protein
MILPRLVTATPLVVQPMLAMGVPLCLTALPLQEPHHPAGPTMEENIKDKQPLTWVPAYSSSPNPMCLSIWFRESQGYWLYCMFHIWFQASSWSIGKWVMIQMLIAHSTKCWSEFDHDKNSICDARVKQLSSLQVATAQRPWTDCHSSKPMGFFSHVRCLRFDYQLLRNSLGDYYRSIRREITLLFLDWLWSR